MGCKSTKKLVPIVFVCEDIASGGLKAIHIAKKGDIKATFDVDGAVTFAMATEPHSVFDVGDKPFVLVEFNNKDGATKFTDVKTVQATGQSEAIPVITIQLPKMTKDKRDALSGYSSPGVELVALVWTAADTYQLIGLDFGLYGSEVNGDSGASRGDLNAYTLTLTGSESHLSRIITDVEYEAALALAVTA